MKICVINTGGTISCVGDPLAPMSATEFAAAARVALDPVVAEMFPDTTLTYETGLQFPESGNGSLDSTNLQPSDWCLMAGRILDTYADYDGFVVLHGTDSMDFSASALPFLLNVFDGNGFGVAVLSKPVVVTGSQVPMFHRSAAGGGNLTLNFNTDAFQNFCGAVACARLGFPEVCVYFDGHLFRGNRVLKVNASEFRAFNSRNYPPLARFGIELTQYPQRVLAGPAAPEVSLDHPAALQTAKQQLDAVAESIGRHPVMQFNAFPAAFNQTKGTAIIADLISACIGQGIRGLVLESYGEGNFPSGNPDSAPDGAIYKALQSASDAGVVVIDSTQVIAGSVDESAYAAGAWLSQVGSISSADMTPMAGLAKTTILLAAADHNGWSVDLVKRLIQLNLCGEIRTTSRLDNRRKTTLLPGEAIHALDGSAGLFNDPATGPVLKSSDGATLWSPLRETGTIGAGRLILQGDGDLVVRNAANKELWSAATGGGAETPSVLTIQGSFEDGTLSLAIHDYARQVCTNVLYSQAAVASDLSARDNHQSGT